MPRNQLNQVTKEKLYKRASSFHIFKTSHLNQNKL